MKSLFLRTVRIEQHTQKVENVVLTSDEKGNTGVDMFVGWYDDYESNSVQQEIEDIKESTGFDASDYEGYKNEHSSTVEKIIKNTDGFKPYNFDYKFKVSAKQARTSIEEKRPFIVSKLGTKRGIVEDIDNIYHTSPKMKITDKSVQRIGFVIADKQMKQFTLKDKKKGKYKGVIDDGYLILKKKPFNTRKIGYIKLQESTQQKDLYVEVVQNRGYKWLAALLIILGLAGLFIYTRDYTDWHFNMDGLTVYKTQEVIEYQESELVISLNGTPVLKDGKVNFNLSSEPADGITYIARLYDENNNLIYESEEINAGSGLSRIELQGELAVGEHECTLICESYRNGNYLGTVESDLVLNVKGGETNEE